MGIPREFVIKDNNLYTYPISEIIKLRKSNNPIF